MLNKWSFLGIVLVLVSSTLQAEDLNGVIVHQGYDRTYVLHIPPQYDGSDSLPLVINLHGGGGSAQQQAIMTQMNPKADSEGFFVVYPNGTQLPIGYFGWNAGEWSLSNIDDVDFISVLIDTLVANYRVDTLRIFATGFSLGAMMCHRLACELSERIAAVAPVEGGLTIDDWNSCQPQRLIPIMHLHHRYDASVPYYGDPTKQWAPPIDSVMEYWAQTNGCDIGPDTFYNEQGALKQTWSRADDSCEVVFWTLEEGNGHAWPGTPTGSQELSANNEMWEFFMTHPIPVKEEEPSVEELPVDYRIDISSSPVVTHSATIRFTLDKPGRVELKLYDKLGRETTTLLNESLGAGSHEVIVDVGKLSAGVYFCRLTASGTTTVAPLVIAR